VFAAVQRACWQAVAAARPHVATPQWDALLAGGAALTAREPSPAAWHALARGGRGRPGATMGAFPPGAAGATGALESLPAGARIDDESTDGGGLARLAPLRTLGQAGTTWMVAESPRGVVLVDPHAAHEKVLYGELIAAWDRPAAGEGARGSQLLLVPEVVECDGGRMARLEANVELVAACGFDIEPFGPAMVRCSAVPAACAGGDVARLVADLLDGLDEAGSVAVGERRHRVAALVACHAAVRFGDVLEPTEQQRLLDRLMTAPGGTTCPHGRPTVVLLEDADLRRLFRRPAT